jgi:hypothetical protein
MRNETISKSRQSSKISGAKYLVSFHTVNNKTSEMYVFDN